METLTSKKIYRMLWRWHFYAGVFVIPFVLILSVSGALYLFKPQIDALHDAPYRNLTINGELAKPEKILMAAFVAVPNSQLHSYELPREKSDAVNVLLNAKNTNKNNEKMRVYIHPQTLEILAIEHEDDRFLRIVHDIHGELLIGKAGAIIVELAASWAIVLVLTGIYLSWPRNSRGVAGVLYPRLYLKGRLFWRDLHAVTGIWVALLVLFLLLSGLPWAQVWGSAFKEVRKITGATAITQDWVVAGEHHHHDDTTEMVNNKTQASFNTIIANAEQLQFSYPVLVSPPTQQSVYWSVKSNAQNRPLRADAYVDSMSGQVINVQTFSQRHVLDRVVGIGVAAHEGQLFGWLNQLLGLLTALALIMLSVSGFIMWRKRAPGGVLGAPPVVENNKLGMGFAVIIVISAILLPMLGVSLILLVLLELFLFRHWKNARMWLGL